MAGAAEHEQPDDVLGSWREVRPTGDERVVGTSDAVTLQHRAHREAGEAHTAVGQEATSRDAAAEVSHGGLLRNTRGARRLARAAWNSTNRHELIVVQQHVHKV